MTGDLLDLVHVPPRLARLPVDVLDAYARWSAERHSAGAVADPRLFAVGTPGLSLRVRHILAAARDRQLLETAATLGVVVEPGDVEDALQLLDSATPPASLAA